MFMAIILSVVLLIAGIGGLILIHICVVGRAFRTGHSNEVVLRFSIGSELIARRTGMPKGDIEKLPCFDFKGESSNVVSGEGVTGARSVAVDCAVCLESFKCGEKCRVLPLCSHNFHAKCVDYWLSKTPICPICRSPVTYPWKVELVSGDEECVREVVEGRELRLESIEEVTENQAGENG